MANYERIVTVLNIDDRHLFGDQSFKCYFFLELYRLFLATINDSVYIYDSILIAYEEIRY